ncbi:hypothetical protein HRbin16_02702 [bacterium HR16]|nr:hypothetical protein HRbin16_02702 [bacterium HR16]
MPILPRVGAVSIHHVNGSRRLLQHPLTGVAPPYDAPVRTRVVILPRREVPHLYPVEHIREVQGVAVRAEVDIQRLADPGRVGVVRRLQLGREEDTGVLHVRLQQGGPVHPRTRRTAGVALIWQPEAQQFFVVVLRVHHQRQTLLLHIADVRRLTCLRARLRKHGEQNCRQYRDNRDNDEQLDKRKAFVLHLKGPPFSFLYLLLVLVRMQVLACGR